MFGDPLVERSFRAIWPHAAEVIYSEMLILIEEEFILLVGQSTGNVSPLPDRPDHAQAGTISGAT
jgi:hypothetical protein